MKQHQFTVTLEYTADADGQPVNETPLRFTAPNHDNIFQIVERMKQSGRFSNEEDAARFAVGLKLMGEVLLAHKKEPFFSELGPHFGEMMKIIKGRQP